jgi:hypothetical protein
MPAATNRTQLLEVTSAEFEKLAGVLARLDHETAIRPFEDGVSIKDVIGHRAHWIDLFFGWYTAGQAGEKPDIPARGYKWNRLKEYNAKLRARQADLTWDEVRDMLDHEHARLMGFVAGKSDGALYGAPMQGGGNHWTTGRWAEAAGPSAYRSALKYIRACLRARDASGGDI